MREPSAGGESSDGQAAGPLAGLLRRCQMPPAHFDELHASPGTLRDEWEVFARLAGEMGPAQLGAAQATIERQLQDNGVTYNVHAGSGPPRPWSLHVLPHIVPARDWERLQPGLEQRARLLEAVAADIYGPQRLLASGHLPPALIFNDPGFLRACHGVRPVSGTRLLVLAFDLARSPKGEWTVVSARTQAPSGAGYALENRLTVSRVFSDAFRDQRVRRLAPYFHTLRETLLDHAPCPSGRPHIVLLTAGRFNETYFEHAYLSQYLGFTLVEGADLTVRDDRVFLKTVSGLRPVHGILRRLDDSYCDPLELRADSTLGVPGLVQAWRAGHVLVANAFGSGVLESPGLNRHLPGLCRELLGEELLIPSPGAWTGGTPAELDARLARLDQLVIKPLHAASMPDVIIGATLDADARRTWAARIRATPDDFVLEEYLPLSHVPVWREGDLQASGMMMRAFVVADGRGGYQAMAGGLTRVAGRDRLIVSGHRGGGSKDTWVLSTTPVERFSLLRGRIQPAAIARSDRVVSSRSAEHLFWLGRYAERSENTARLLRAVLARLDQGDPVISGASAPVVAICQQAGLLPHAEDETPETPPREWGARDFVRTLLRGLADAEGMRSVGWNVAQTAAVASTVRDRLSGDNTRVLNQLTGAMPRRGARPPTLSGALDLLDRVILWLVAAGGLEMAHMTRDDGWRFMSLGRHIERVLHVTTTTRCVAGAHAVGDPALLEWLLDLSDSIITYRARYMGRAEWAPVVDLLIFDDRNPRSSAFQMAKLAKHVRLLPDANLGGLSDELNELSARRNSEALRSAAFERTPPFREFLAACERTALDASDALTLRYFSHVYEPAHATLL
ncbi:MAG: circularly permuted type 2 ATP-grasp protein [Acidobacteria bacterium]|nr:circularly permuted type 2 ATP-grasp protein [Acidobacteriota bacterium]